MSFENKYPYTDFHELNLDWFLKEFNKLLAEWADLAADNEEFKQTMTERFNTLDQTVHEFIQFVNNYFDNLDVQQEINNKLNDMVEDGTMSELLRPYFNAFTVEINARMRNQDDRISVLEGRMDTFTHLTDGSTSGDAELQDIRVGYNGEVYPSAGNAVRSQISDVRSVLTEVALNGYYTTEPHDQYIECAAGQIISDGTVSPNYKCAYKWLTAEEEALKTIYFDDTTYKMNLCYMLNGTVASYTTWITTSPVTINDSIQHDTVGISFQRIDNVNVTEEEMENTLYFVIPGENVGNLVTKNDLSKDRGLKCIYPDGFTSRIKPDIYYGARFTAEIDTRDYKVTGDTVAWISTTGNDSTGDGTENSPYLTLTKALTVATTIHVKEGTYYQGTHYVNNVQISEKNIIGHGTVKFQNDNSDHYITTLNNVYIENIEFYHGTSNTNNLMNTSSNTDGKTACFVNCTFVGGLNCLAITAIDAVVAGCVAHDSKFDGFNYHAYNGRIPNVLEMDCIAYNNGSALSGSNSCNGSTSHDGCKIIRLNGIYHDCYGGVVADIGLTDGETTKSVNYGCIAYTSNGETFFNASFWASYNTEMYMYDCKSYGSDYDITALNDSVVVSRRLTTGRNVPSVYKADDATVLQY